MIIDKLENAQKYYTLGVSIEQGLKFLQNTDLNMLECKRLDICGEKIWANVQEYLTKNKNDALWEVHKKYIDIQYLISGCEKMGWANLSAFIPKDKFDVQKDIQFGEINKNSSNGYVIVPQGYFVIFTPDDVHKPSLRVNNAQKVKKIVLKIEC